ncbi:MAG: hypothetical protein DRJ03_11695 [Chloroflexi bacterium]|nr:MAG: hypothetical protein DRJ03_11695 [Chloroflexota bacterium]
MRKTKKKNLPKWQKKLNAEERDHLKETADGSVTLAKFKKCVEWQTKNDVVCWTCKSIACKFELQG